MATFKENLVLSQISYVNFITGNEKGQTIGDMLRNEKSSLSKFLNEGGNSIWRESLESMRDWKVINYQPNKPSGFSATAFQSPKGEIVIACRGTEFPTLPDLYNDGKIATAFNEKMIAQFGDAQKFVCETMGIMSLNELPSTNNLSFTGHSLGGGLAQYLVYLTRTKGTEATTFNAVGVGQCLNDATGKYPQIKNYCDTWDVVGNFGIALGERIYTENAQRLDDPKFPKLNGSTPLQFIKDYCKYQVQQYQGNNWLTDGLKRQINTILLGTPYSHGLNNFLNKSDQTGQFVESNRISASEVQLAQLISQGIRLEKAGLKLAGSTFNEVTQMIARQFQEKPKPDSAFVWPKHFTQDTPTRDFLAMAAKTKQDNLVKAFGYPTYDQLLKNSQACGQKDGVSYYATETKTGQVILWGNRDYQPLLEFPNRKTWESAPPTEQLIRNATAPQTMKANAQSMGIR